VEKITASMAKVSTISSETRVGMEEITTAISELYKAFENILKTGIQNNENVSELELLIAQFKLQEDNLTLPNLKTKY
jgi:methyl-accepting chemotaxis protein